MMTRTLKVVKNENYKADKKVNPSIDVDEGALPKGPSYIDLEFNEVQAFMIMVHVQQVMQ